LWVRSGFSKESVAGALTFFPPNPALYKFKRCSSTGEELDDEEVDEEEDIEDEFKEDDEDEDDVGDEDAEDLQFVMDAPSPSPGISSVPQEEEHSLKSKPSKSAKPSKKRNKKKKGTMETLAERNRKLKKKSQARFEKDSRDAASGIIYKFIPDPRIPVPRFDNGTMNSIKIYNPKVKSYIAALIYRVNNSSDKVKTLIYSHGNATDVGAMSFICAILAKNLNINVVVYDYSGYGESGGIALESNTYSDIDVVYNYALNFIAHGKPRNLIIYGQSVGSGPSCYIAMKKTIGGLILHSPFMSGMRVLTPSRALACLDIFPNIDRIQYVKCPVLIIHGVLDEEVDIGHGHALYQAVNPQYRRDPWWVPDRGHNDITDGAGKMTEYIQRLGAFLQSLDVVSDKSKDENGIDTSGASLVEKGVMIR